MKAKDVAYDHSLPPFLQRLHAGGKYEPAVPRAKRHTDPLEDDGPTVVDESGEVVNKQEYERLFQGNSCKQEAVNESRKPVKVVTEDEPDGEPHKEVPSSSKRKPVRVAARGETYTAESSPVKRKATNVQEEQPKKKAKPKQVKLAFDDE
ncbi:hypothetical protein K470DRAFT_141093 [Piedraia hortae CBS 480.64]|uniref:DUF4604 domain-containing protein n=1 Tax=Piedraia hortae CBS 480.64 TaxID=1314780 RepID=A0A6A7C7G2_9PEZI|nr:hypothetical protein K470DRAFT_141093 [Piedraia hortae CBS 480.64]